MPTYALPDSVYAEYTKLSREQRRAFRRALARFIEALRHKPPTFPPGLRVKGVQGSPAIFEMSFAPDGRATFEYGDEVTPGEPHVIWRRVGTTRSCAHPERTQTEPWPRSIRTRARLNAPRFS